MEIIDMDSMNINEKILDFPQGEVYIKYEVEDDDYMVMSGNKVCFISMAMTVEEMLEVLDMSLFNNVLKNMDTIMSI